MAFQCTLLIYGNMKIRFVQTRREINKSEKIDVKIFYMSEIEVLSFFFVSLQVSTSLKYIQTIKSK